MSITTERAFELQIWRRMRQPWSTARAEIVAQRHIEHASQAVAAPGYIGQSFWFPEIDNV